MIFFKKRIKIKIPFKSTEQEIATALESNPRIYKILTSLYNNGFIDGIKNKKDKLGEMK
jgi:hypothetical protein